MTAQPEQVPDDDLLQAAQVPVQVCLEGVQVQDGVGHQLAGPMIGHLPPALCAVQRMWGVLWVEAQVLQGAARAQGVDWLVLQQHQVAGRPRCPAAASH